MHEHLVDACTVHVDYFETETVPGECFAGGGDVFQLVEEESAQGVVFVVAVELFAVELFEKL